MQSMHQQQNGKHGFRAPPGYGVLVATHQVDPQPEHDLAGGTAFVHEYQRGGKVITLRLEGTDGRTKKLDFIWEVQNGRTTPLGSKLLFQSRPNRKKGESWESAAYVEHRVDVYRGEQGGLFAITPYGLVTLQQARPVRQPNAAGMFSADAFRAALAKDQQAYEARRAARGPTPAAATAMAADSELARTALGVVKTRTKPGAPAQWNDVVDALATMGFQATAAEDALDQLVEAHQLEQPTLTTLRIPDAATAPAPAGHEDDADSGESPAQPDGSGAPEGHAAAGAEAA